MISSVLKENEKRANRLAFYLFLAFLGVALVDIILNETGVFRIRYSFRFLVYALVIVDCLFPILCSRSRKLSQHALKWINLTCVVILVAWIDLAANYNSTLLLAVPLIMAVAYFSRRTTLITFFASVMIFAGSEFVGSLGIGLLDSNHVTIPEGTVLTIHGTLKQTLVAAGFRNAQYSRDLMVLGYLPRLLALLLLFVVAIFVTRFGYEMLLQQARSTAESTRLSTELQFAGDLQANALPPVEGINGKYNFSIAAGMTAAREAGGDFYDFSMIDDTHLALVIADVCGKGVPAAMFMMSAREKLRSAFAPGRTPGEILRMMNNSLCENNKQRMFVTVWLGLLDITTGELVSANAGHEDPLLQRRGGRFAVLRERHGIAAGVRKDRDYPEQTVWLQPGDILVQFTDGITEAQNESGEFYGEARFTADLNRRFQEKTASAEEVKAGIGELVADFAGNARQTDDITMLVVKYK